jgi:hypothetical protein
MRHLVYNTRCSAVPINSSLLTITLYSSVRTTPVYNDTKHLSWRYNRVSTVFQLRTLQRPSCHSHVLHTTWVSPTIFNIAHCHSGVEISTESDRSAVFDGVSGGGCRIFCLTVTQPPSLPCSLFSLCLRGYDGMLVGEYLPSFRRTVVSSNSGGSCPKILSKQ